MSLLHNRFHISLKVHKSSEKAENISSKSHRLKLTRYMYCMSGVTLYIFSASSSSQIIEV